MPLRSHFGEFSLDSESRQLFRGGEEIHLEPKAFELLELLVASRPKALSKLQIRQRLWPDTVVSDASLTVLVYDLRGVLGDDAKEPRYLRTVHGFGYAFAEEVAGPESQETEPQRDAPEPNQQVPRTSAGPPDVPSGAPSRRGPYGDRWRLAVGFSALLVIALGLVLVSRALLKKDGPRSGAPRVPSQLTFGSGAIMATWSPDGRMFAYCSDRSGNTDVWVQQVSGGDPIRITDDPASDCEPAWSPDGAQIAFWSAREGGGLYLVPALGGRARRLNSLGHLPKWSPDGSKLLVVSALYDLYYSLRVIDAVRGDAHDLALPRGMGQFFPTADWHPDGRISILERSRVDDSVRFLTLPLGEGQPILSEIPDAIRQQLRESGLALISFLWAPSGDALYFQAWAQTTTNLFRVRVDPQTLRWRSAPEGITTSPGSLWVFSLSRDGKRLLYSAFTGEPYPLWSLPFDDATGRLRGEGGVIRTFGNWPSLPWLSPDGTHLVYQSLAQNHVDLRDQDLPNGDAHVLATDVAANELAPNSTDARWVAYHSARTDSLMLLNRETGHEEAIGARLIPWGFSPDGHWIVATRSEEGRRARLLLVSTETATATNQPEHELAADPGADLQEAQFSPNGRWIAFEASADGPPQRSTLRVMPGTGGAWRPLVDTALTARKPRWSPEGRILYFLLRQTELDNVWGLHFDPVRGAPMGEPFPVTALHSMIRHVYSFSHASDFAISRNRLVVPMEDYTNTSIWMLDNVDQ